MARKKGSSKSSAKSTPRHSQPQRLRSRNKPWAQAQEAVTAVTQQFSLRDEARWMSGHRSHAFDSGKKLRNLPIAFVSAGLLEGTIKEKGPQVAPAAPPSPLNSDALAQMSIRSPSTSSSVSSAASSMSSEEIVVFRGRLNTPSAPSVATATASSTNDTRPAQRTPSAQTDASIVITANPSTQGLTAATTSDQNTPQYTSSDVPQLTGASSDEPVSPPAALAASVSEKRTVATKAPATAPSDESDINSDTNSVVLTIFDKRRQGRPIWEGQTTPWVSRSKPGIGWLPVRDRPDMEAFLGGEVNPQDAAMDDYMQNLDEFGLKDEMIASAGFALREMDLDAGSHNDWESKANPLEHQDKEDPDDGWDSDMLRDLDGLSTSTDVEDTIARILSKRTRTTGLQYLVIYEGSTPDDARWLPASFLKSPAEQVLVRKFEATLLARPQPMSSSCDSSDSDFEEADDDDDADGDDQELDDATIAKVLQKQEELGLGSDEVLLYGHDTYFDDPIGASTTTVSFGIDRPSKKRQQRVGGGRRAEPSFPSACAMADALSMDPYGGFDIMDTERPSLRPRKKGRRGQMPPELDDSDLNEQLQASWAADRAKKRLKKAEREELRKQGLLGRKGKAPDLGVKYKDGFEMMEVVEEIRGFMLSDMQTLSLPPMESHRRAVIHQFVSRLGIHSKSRGDGASRFTVLSKTRLTKALDHDDFDALLQQKKFTNRMKGSFPPSGRKKERNTKARPTVSYRDGEVVGASAPELGPENRGRTLLEKMGWSKGMALGAHDNKGILLPIAHTVKTNKAGLQ